MEIVGGLHLEMCSQYFVDLKRTVHIIHIRPNLSRMKIETNVATGVAFWSAFTFFRIKTYQDPSVTCFCHP